MNNEEPMSLRDTARGVAVRASILGIGGAVAAGLVLSLGLKAAGALVKTLVGLFALSVVGGLAVWEVHRVKKRFSEDTL